MPSGRDTSKRNHADQQFKQTAVSDVAARDIQIGQIVQKIVYLGLPFNNHHLRFVQFLANSAYLTCLIGGGIRLWQNGADFTTLLLLIVGSGLLSLTCLYYAWFWKPEVQDKGAELPDSDELVKVQHTKQQSRQQTRRLAMVGIFAVPLLTCAGFFVWKSLPPSNVLLLIANFDGVEPQRYRVTETILRELRSAIKPYKDVKVQPLYKIITEQQGTEIARDEGDQKKATIVIWGDYGVTSTNVQISVHFEVLKPPTYFPELRQEANGQAQIRALSDLKGFVLQTHLSKEITYLTLFTLGMVQYARDDWDGAIARFSDALSQLKQTKEPVTLLGQDAVYFYRAIAYDYKGNYKEAIADYTQAISIKPDDAESYHNRGIDYNDLGNYRQAIADFTLALILKPDYSEAYNNRGYAYARLPNYSRAIADFNQAIKLKPDNAHAYLNRGLAYAEQGKDSQAIADYTKAIELKPDFAYAYFNRGSVYYFDLDNYSQAIADFNQAIKLQKDFAYAYNSRGLAYSALHNYSQAIADFNQAIKLQKDFAYAYNNRGIVYFEQRNYSQAIADFNQAIKLKPDYGEPYYNKAFIYGLERKNKEAIESLQQAIQLDVDGTFREAAKTNSAFDSIRKNEQFRALVGE